MLIEKPWGYEVIWAKTPKYLGKILHINAGSSLSLQFHREKDETVYVLKGTLTLEICLPIQMQADGSWDISAFESQKFTKTLNPGESYRIVPTMIHRMAASDESVEILEVSTPEIDDVVRLVDKYGRAPITS